MRSLFLGLFALLGTTLLLAQSTPPASHVRDVAPALIAFTNATVHIDARTVVAKATLVIKDGKVLAVGEKVSIPPGAVVRDLQGLHIWPGLIEPYSDLGLPALTAEERKTDVRAARHWNGAVRADAQAHKEYEPDASRASDLRAQGFGMVITHRMDGVARGTSAAVLLNDEPVAKAVVEADVAAHFSLRKGSSPDSYPSSQMGAIALLRQSMLDARWAAAHPRAPERDAALVALAEQLKGRLVVEAGDRNEVLRWAKLLAEFQLPAIVKGAGDEYARLEAIRAAGLPLIIPVDLPLAFDVEDPYDAQEVSFARLKHWEMAPYNPGMLDTAGVVFAFTAHGRKDLKELWKDLRKMVACGLDSARAVEAFTSDVARLFGADDRIGALRPGMIANLLITSDHLLAEKNILHENWVGGQRYVLDDAARSDLRGTYDLNLADAIWTLEVSGERRKLEAKVRRPNEADSLAVKVRFEHQGTLINLSFAPKNDPQAITRLSGTVHANGGLWDGQGQRPGGEWFPWSALRKAATVPKRKGDRADSAKVVPPVAPGPITYPMVGYGWVTPPEQATVIFRKATVWTNTAQGILRNTDVCIHQGRIFAVGAALDTIALFPGKRRPKIVEVNAEGMHLTCGIIDEHSHIAISRGVNEGSMSVSAQVRIGDVVNPDDINLYRNLAGGVTTVQQLHGSANPIGGQSALIKLRWGHAADSLLIRDAPKHIKFALGENVKQSNWGPSTRFPQTRMGVEQQFYEAFLRARDHAQEWNAWNSLRPKERTGVTPPRRDLQLETLAEILRGERHISCHSYVQSEIDMLMHVADSLGFKVNTFTHILEGYKVAGKMAEHGASGSTFSDWWAYKFEVYDAIPYNAALMHRHGVNTGINSDDAEMSRRLNQEAAKAIKYGGVTPEEAWKMVTLNPARMLKLDHRMGTVEPGKDADVVLWNADPLSITARAMRTYVDGICYYDSRTDAQQRTWIAAERDRLVRAMMAAKADGAPTRKARREHQHLWHCDDIGTEEEQDHDADNTH